MRTDSGRIMDPYERCLARRRGRGARAVAAPWRLRDRAKPVGSLVLLAVIVAAGLWLSPRSIRQTEALFAQVQPGMTRAAVVDLLGEPNEVLHLPTRPDVETLCYGASTRLGRRGPTLSKTFAVLVVDGRVIDKITSDDPRLELDQDG